MNNNKHIKILLDNGLKIKTISKLNESQIKVLAEKFHKLETKEQVIEVPNKKTYKIGPKGGKIGDLSVSQDPSTKEVMVQMGEDATIDFVNDPDATADGMPTTEGEMNEKYKSTAQQKFFWSKCTKSGDKKSRWCKWANEFQKDTKDKNLPEKLHPEKTVKVRKENYERFLEDSIVEMVDKYINPGMTKSQLVNRINEKANKTESFMLRNPKKNSMFSKDEGKEMKTMKRPIGRMFSLGEDTKEKEKTKIKEKEKNPGKKNPFQPKHNPAPKAKGEFKEQEIAPSKPGTKEKTREKDPGKKNPFAPKYNPAPKAGRGSLPNFLKWDKLKVNLK